MMSAVMAIALICGSRYSNTNTYAITEAERCQKKFAECYESEKGDLDTRLIKCIRKGK